MLALKRLTLVLFILLLVILSIRLLPGQQPSAGTGYNVPHLPKLFLGRMWGANPHNPSDPRNAELVGLNGRFAKKIVYDLGHQQVSHVRLNLAGYSPADVSDWYYPERREWFWKRMNLMVEALTFFTP